MATKSILVPVFVFQLDSRRGLKLLLIGHKYSATSDLWEDRYLDEAADQLTGGCQTLRE